MRNPVLAPLLLLAAAAGALPEGEGTVKSEEFNFEISVPKDSIDWKIMPIAEGLAKAGLRVHFQTVFADSNPPAQANLYLSVIPLSKDFAYRSLEKIVRRWAGGMEDHLENPRDRKEEKGRFGEVDHYKVDVKGDYSAGIHQRTWYVAKNGKYIYLLYIDRNYRAVGDEFLDEEIQEIVKSFRFLKVIKPEAHKKGGKKAGDAPVGGPGGTGTKGKKIDPELLKRETFKEPFWRFHCTKPQGMLKEKLSEENKKRDMKYFFSADREGSRLWIQIFAQTEKAKKYSLEKLVEQRLKWWEGEVKVSKDPVINKKYRFPMAKKAVRIDLIGRKSTTRRRIYVLMDCKNGRQYVLSFYLSGTQGTKIWGKTIAAFLKGFRPVKK